VHVYMLLFTRHCKNAIQERLMVNWCDVILFKYMYVIKYFSIKSFEVNSEIKQCNHFFGPP